MPISCAYSTSLFPPALSCCPAARLALVFDAAVTTDNPARIPAPLRIMTEAAKPKSTSSSSSGTLPGSEPAPIVGDKSSFAQTHPNLQRTISRDVPVNYFSPDGDLQRTLSRQQSGWSTHTQDPNADDFDYEKHVRHLLRRAEESGIKQRDLGGSSLLCLFFRSHVESADLGVSQSHSRTLLSPAKAVAYCTAPR